MGGVVFSWSWVLGWFSQYRCFRISSLFRGFWLLQVIGWVCVGPAWLCRNCLYLKFWRWRSLPKVGIVKVRFTIGVRVSEFITSRWIRAIEVFISESVVLIEKLIYYPGVTITIWGFRSFVVGRDGFSVMVTFGVLIRDYCVKIRYI